MFHPTHSEPAGGLLWSAAQLLFQESLASGGNSDSEFHAHLSPTWAHTLFLWVNGKLLPCVISSSYTSFSQLTYTKLFFLITVWGLFLPEHSQSRNKGGGEYKTLLLTSIHNFQLLLCSFFISGQGACTLKWEQVWLASSALHVPSHRALSSMPTQSWHHCFLFLKAPKRVQLILSEHACKSCSSGASKRPCKPSSHPYNINQGQRLGNPGIREVRKRRNFRSKAGYTLNVRRKIP